MTLEPLVSAPPPIPFHAVAAIAALALGVVQLAGPKGTAAHRVLGWAWVSLMAAVAGSSFFITSGGPFDFSWIHGLSLLTLASLPAAVAAARRHRVDAHRRGMGALFGLALLLTGAFTLWPGRIMHQVVFGG